MILHRDDAFAPLSDSGASQNLVGRPVCAVPHLSAGPSLLASLSLLMNRCVGTAQVLKSGLFLLGLD